MSTLENARSSSNVASRAGLARFRQLQEQDTKNNSVQSNFPNGWFYNETRQDQFWQDIESQNSKYVEDVTREGEQQRTFNDIESSAHRVSALLSDFDSIDQDTLMELMQIIEHDDNIGDIDQISIIDDAKNNVLMNIDELKEFAESQSTLMGSIKEWLAEVQSVVRIETKDPVSNEEIPTVDAIFANLSEVLRSYIERSEKAAFLHNDVSDFWAKQNAQLKKIIYARDEEIRSLQAAIQAAQVARQKKITQKKTKANSNESEKISQQSQQIDKQLRLIAEQKAQIEKLKNQLQVSESERVVAQIGSPLSRSQNPSMVNSTVFAANLETETKMSYLNQCIAELNETIIQLKQSVTTEKDKNHTLTKKLNEKEKTVGEMEILLQKYLNQLSLERSKNKEIRPNTDETEKVDKEELYILQMKFQQEIKELKANHAEALVDQAEKLEEKFQKEKTLLLESINSSDTKDLVRLLIDEYDKKFEKTKEEYNKSVENLKMSWTSKLSLLTTQYEARINNMNSAHELELINTKDSLSYEIKKCEMDLTEKFNTELLQMKTDQNNKLNDLNNEIDQKNDEISSLTKDIELLKQKLKIYEPEESILALETIPDEPMEGDQRDFEADIHEKKQEDMQTERFARRYNTLKANLDEQHDWNLNVQRTFHERQVNKMITEYQQPIRTLLLDLQEAVLNAEETDAQDKYDIIADKISQTFITLNQKFEQTEKLKENNQEEMVSLADAAKRNKLLTERIVSLTNELDDLKESQSNQSVIPELEKTIERLKSKIQMLESLQNDDQKLLAKQIDEMEAKYKDELQFKDDLIRELQDAIWKSTKKPLTQSENVVVFNFEGGNYDDYDDYEEDVVSYRPHVANLSSQSSMYVKKNMPILGNIPTSSSTLNNSLALDKSKQSNAVSQPPLSPLGESTSNKVSNIPRKSALPIQSITMKQHFQTSRNAKPTNPRQRRNNLYDVETQISSAEPIVELALKSILDRLTFRRCDAFSVSDGQMEFKDSNSIPKYTTRLPKSSSFRPTGFKAKLYCSPFQAIHRNDNFISLPINSDPFFELEGLPSFGTPITTAIDSYREQTGSQQQTGVNSTYVESTQNNINQENSIMVEREQSKTAYQPESIPKNPETTQKIMKCSRYIICSIKPVPHEPIVIVVNDDQMKTITELQNQLKEMNQDKQKKLLLDISTEASNRLIKSLNQKEARIKELENRPPQVVYDPTIVTIEDKRTDTLSPVQIRESRSKISTNGSDIPTGPIKRAYSSRKKDDFSPSSQHSYQKMRHNSIDEGQSYIHMDDNLSEAEAPSPTREPIQFIVPPEEDIVDAKAVDDPFSAAIQSAISNMRFMAQIRDNTNETLETLKNDYLAYEAYLTALKVFDDNDASFIENLKDVKASMEKTLLAYDLFAKKQKNLLDLVRYSRKKANYMANLYNNLKNKVTDEQLTNQSKTLSNFTANDSPLKIFEEIGAVLNVLEKLELEFSIDDNQQFEELKRTYKRHKPKSDKDNVDKQIADKLLMKTKEFIEGLRNKQDLKIEQSEIVSTISHNEVKSLKHKLKKSLEMNENLKKDLYRAQEENANQKDTIAALRYDLKSEKEQNDQTLTMYQAQIRTLRDLLNELDENGENGKTRSLSTSTEMLTKIKKEVLNMQQLLDAQTIELNDSRSTISKMKETIRQNEFTITHLKHDLEESELKYLELDDKLRKQKEEMLFKEANQISKEQEEDDNDDIKKMQRKQIEQAQADQKWLSKRIRELEEKLVKTKKHLNEVIDENDELKFKFALRQYEVQSSIEKSTIGTQTILRILNKKSRSSSPLRNEKKVSNGNKTPPRDSSASESQIHSPEPRVQLKFDPSTQSSQSEYILNSSFVLLLEEEEEDGDIYIDNEVLIPENQDDENAKIVSDDKFIDVHSPLSFKNRKNSNKDKNILYMLNDPRNKRPAKVITKNPKVFIPKASPDQSLSIGFDDKHPYRATSSMSSNRNRGCLYQSTVTPVNYAVLLKKPLHDLSISATRINTPELNMRENEQRKTNGILSKKPTTSRSSNTQPYVFEGSNDNVESLRITNVQFTDNSNMVQNTPIIQRPSTSMTRNSKSSTSTQSQNRGVNQQKAIKSTEEEEIKFILTSLRNKVKKLLASNEKKDEIILDLNRRISELTLVLNRSKIDNIRLADTANRMKLRFDNINQRLAAAMNELAIRHEENSALRRQLIHLKHAAIPTMPLLRRMHKAKEEQDKINIEEDQAKSKLENTKQIAKKATNDQVRQHLNSMIKNSQQSLLRMEARRRYWQEVERKQMISVLSAISLISQDIPDIQQLKLPYSSPFLSMKSGKNTPTVQKRTQSYVNYMNNQDKLGDIEVISLNTQANATQAENADNIDIDITYEPLSNPIIEPIKNHTSSQRSPKSQTPRESNENHE